MAQLTHNISFDCTQIQALRKLFKEKGEEMGMNKVSLNDIVMYAVARTLMMPEHRALNANLIDDGKTMKYYNCVNLGMACDTDRGLMVPTIFGADKMSLKQLSDTAKKLAKECREGHINPDYLQGGSFTVSNVGAYGIESFTPVINPPQTGILGVCGITTPRARSERPDRGLSGHGPVAHLRPSRAGWQPRLPLPQGPQVQSRKLHPASGAGLMNGGTVYV